MVLPGLIDSHVHAPAGVDVRVRIIPSHRWKRSGGARLHHCAHEGRAPGEWIATSQIFITRLKRARYPTRAELDAAAPQHPVAFRTGPDIMLNTLALQKCGFTRDWTVKDGARLPREGCQWRTQRARARHRPLQHRHQERAAALLRRRITWAASRS